MLHCLNSDMTVLERQRSRKNWQHQQEQQGNRQDLFCETGYGDVLCSSLQIQNPQGMMMVMDGYDSALGELKPDPDSENGWPELGKLDIPFGSSTGLDVSSAVTRESFKKRKAENPKVVVVGESDSSKEKRVKVSGSCGGDAEESKVTEQNRSNNKNNVKPSTSRSNKEAASAENSKGSEVQNQKPDYIHVRARRGQATDSHSLAERVRREKISERMKYLQDLVPGCDKITGKAGMLDEIINYVQSLQKQVEFLSMKLAAVNPRLDFNTDDLFAKEVFPTCAPSFATLGMASSEMANPAVAAAAAYLDFNNMGMMNPPPDMGLLRRTISAPLSFPETFLDSSSSSSSSSNCFTQMLPPSTWDGDFQIQNLYNLAFDQGQGRISSFPSQPFTGLTEASNLKMEM